MNNICLIILIGIPGAGKTTLCNKLKLSLGISYKVKMYSYDDFTTDFSKQGRQVVYDKISEYVVQKLNDSSSKHVILIDDNMYYKSMRKQYTYLARKFGLTLLQMYIKIDLQTAIQRNNARSNIVPIDVITNISVKLEEPNEDSSLVILDGSRDFDENILRNIEKKIYEVFQIALKPNTEIQNNNIDTYHRDIDLELRKIVGEYCRANPQLSSKYNILRKEILCKIKLDNSKMYSHKDISLLFRSNINNSISK